MPDKPYTIDEAIFKIPPIKCDEIPKPTYNPTDSVTLPNVRVGLAVSSMKNHTTDEGYQIFQGLENYGYMLQGYGYHTGHPEHGDRVNVEDIVNYWEPGTIVMQDVREWMGLTADRSRDIKMRFTHIDILRGREDIFKCTILKDCQSNLPLNIETATRIGCHAWIHYYNPKVVKHLAPYIRPQNLIRTWHTIDPLALPKNWKNDLARLSNTSVYQNLGIDAIKPTGGISISSSERNKGCIISGAISDAYPLRRRLANHHWMLPQTTVLRHPGYHARGCHTPEYLTTLCRYKVAICTSSRYGYALRKLIEATACGCMVLTDLPVDEVLPEIDGNLIRVRPDDSTESIARTIRKAISGYDHDKQLEYAVKAILRYDYRVECARLAKAIEYARITYND